MSISIDRVAHGGTAIPNPGETYERALTVSGRSTEAGAIIRITDGVDGPPLGFSSPVAEGHFAADLSGLEVKTYHLVAAPRGGDEYSVAWVVKVKARP